MQFDSEKQEQAYQKLQEQCDPKNGFQPAAENLPGFVIRNEGALVVMLALPWGPDKAVIQFRGLMTRDVPQNGKAARWLLERNDETVLGAFGWSSNSGIFFGHTILADDMDPSEFTASLIAVATTASTFGPQIIDKFGGRPFFEE
jgi:hypothetical protein